MPTMLTIKKAAEKTGLPYEYIRKLCVQGKIVFVRSGNKYFINMDKFAQFLNGELGNAAGVD